MSPLSPKCPGKYDADDEEVQHFYTLLFNLIVSHTKKYCLKKCWSLDVKALLLQLHLQCTQSYYLLEEEEQTEAAETRKMLADSSQNLANCLQKVTDNSSSANVLTEVVKNLKH
jgi:hypothetical protein